jgi:hypothetical protein
LICGLVKIKNYEFIKMKKSRWFVIAGSVSIMAVIAIFVYYYTQILFPPPSLPSTKHTFKVREIYPTIQNGRQWFINLDNPGKDRIFDPNSKIKQQPDGSWQIRGSNNGKM